MIDCTNVAFAYGITPVIKNISLHITKGECAGLIGPNGGGKTTLLKLLLGLYKPKEGKITINGKSPEETRHFIGYVPQSQNIDRDFPLSTLELILFGSLFRSPYFFSFPKDLKRRAKELLEELGIGKMANKPFGSLSGGQLQRALFARALLSDPELLLLDEPTSCLDPEGEEKIINMLKELKKQKTILLVSHNLETIAALSDSVYSIHHTIEKLDKKEICSHFAYGLYPKPKKAP